MVLQQQRQLAAQQLNAMRVLNGTIGTLYGSINTTQRFMTRAMEVDDKVRVQCGLHCACWLV